VSSPAKRVMVVGGGGREHAIVRALLRSPQAPEVLCAPGNGGIGRHARCFDVAAEDVDGLVRLAAEQRVDLTVVGPEAPLVAGLVDRLSEEGLAAFGPSKAAARLEGSKAFAKQVMSEAGVPTASHVVLDSFEEAERQIDSTSYPAVLKADGLAAGKGVVIAGSPDEARAALEAFFLERRFGDAAEHVILEEHLEGEELSLLALCDGENVVPMAPARDYKRIGEGDIGPNTGGMGSFSPVPGLDPDRCAELIDMVHRPVLDALEGRGTPYAGVLYAGLMLTATGPKVLEFNCRFGDPETQAVLPRLKSDFLEMLESCVVAGGLGDEVLEWSDEWAVTVVMASAGYPASSSKGDVIRGLDAAERERGVEITHAGTAESNGSIVTAGGRVLNVTGMGPTPEAARTKAYAAIDQISFDGAQFRRDIASGVIDSVHVATD
jgi:phosphoribosylamine---glycine ligase